MAGPLLAEQVDGDPFGFGSRHPGVPFLDYCSPLFEVFTLVWGHLLAFLEEGTQRFGNLRDDAAVVIGAWPCQRLNTISQIPDLLPEGGDLLREGVSLGLGFLGTVLRGIAVALHTGRTLRPILEYRHQREHGIVATRR